MVKSLCRYYAIEIDGKAFDSTQFRVLLLFFDGIFYYSMLRLIVPTTLHVPFTVLFYCLRMIDLFGYSSVLGYFIFGTVPSGKSNTTLGNTMRSVMFVRIIAACCQFREGIDFFFFATGDDIFL